MRLYALVTLRIPQYNMRTILQRVLAGFLLTGIIGLSPAAAQMPSTATSQQAQETPWPQPESIWTSIFEQQMEQLLRMPDEHRQDEAMRLIIHYARIADQQEQAVFDFQSAVPRLLAIFRTEQDPSRRLLALSALHAIGDTSAMQTLAEWIPHERSERIRRHTIYVLNANQ